MERRFDKWLVGAGGLVALLVVAIVLTWQNTRQLSEDALWVDHTHEVITDLENVLSLAKDAETGGRGYVITDEPRYLEPYNTAVAAINKQVDDLEGLTADNHRQQERFPELRQRISYVLKEWDRLITLRKDKGFDAARKEILTDRGKAEMDALRAVVAEMIRHEQDLLRDRTEKRWHTYNSAVITGLLSGVASVAGVIAFIVLLRRHLATRSAAAAAIAEQGERLRTTLASIGDGVITTDSEGRITSMNAVAELLTGWKVVEATGQPLVKVFSIVNEETRQEVENPATKAMREGVIVGLANHTLLIANNGTERPIDDSAAPIRCDEGKIVGCVLVFRDVMQRRQHEQELVDREREFRTLAESIPQLCWMANPDGPIYWYNRRWYDYTGTTFEQMEGWGWQSVHDPDELPKVLEKWKGSLATGQPFDMVFPLKGKDGVFRPYLTRIMPFKDGEGRVIRWFGTNTDISELRALEQALKDADHRKDEFLAMLAHELRNPLAPLRNGLQVMRLAGNDRQAVEQARNMMERQLHHMVRLVDDLLDVSRITRGKLELRKQRIDLASVVGHAVEVCEPLVKQNGHELTVNLPEEAVYVDADKTRLAQALCNLLSNAAKYSDRGTPIWLSAERQGDEAVIRVKDAGVGIPPNMLPKVFDLFWQVDRSLEKSRGGLGVGLTIVKQLLEMHGGRVEANSEGQGMGSEFIIRLPVVMSVAQEQQEEDGDPQPRSTARHRILVVDDNVDAASSLAMLLKIMGNEVRTAHDGLEAVDTAAAYRPDMILLDIGMPRLNGYDACRRIREQPWGKNVFIVALTGWGQEEDRRRSREAGFNGHLVKPVEPAALEKLLVELKSDTA